jgi:hypothetical protein
VLASAGGSTRTLGRTTGSVSWSQPEHTTQTLRCSALVHFTASNHRLASFGLAASALRGSIPGARFTLRQSVRRPAAVGKLSAALSLVSGGRMTTTVQAARTRSRFAARVRVILAPTTSHYPRCGLTPRSTPTRSGRQRKPGVRRHRHLRTPGLRRLPTRSALTRTLGPTNRRRGMAHA